MKELKRNINSLRDCKEKICKRNNSDNKRVLMSHLLEMALKISTELVAAVVVGSNNRVYFGQLV